MVIRVVCSKCSRTLEAPDHLAGKSGKCPNCGADVQFSATVTPAIAASASGRIIREHDSGRTIMSGGLLTAAPIAIAAFLAGLGLGWLAFSPTMTNAALADELAKANVILARHEKQATNRAAAREREEADRQKTDKPLSTSIDTIVKLVTETYSANPLVDVGDLIHNLDLKAGVRVQFRGTPKAVRLITVAIDEHPQLGIEIASAISDELTNNADDVKRFIKSAAFPVRNVYSEVLFGESIDVRIDHDGGAIEFFSAAPTANRFEERHRLPN